MGREIWQSPAIRALNPSPIHAMQTTDSRNVTSDLREVREMLLGILFYCPLGGNPKDCNCHSIRNLSTGKRFEWLNQLTDQESLGIYRNHILCLKRKVGRSDYTSWPVTTGLDDAGVSL